MKRLACLFAMPALLSADWKIVTRTGASTLTEYFKGSLRRMVFFAGIHERHGLRAPPPSQTGGTIFGSTRSSSGLLRSGPMRRDRRSSLSGRLLILVSENSSSGAQRATWSAA